MELINIYIHDVKCDLIKFANENNKIDKLHNFIKINNIFKESFISYYF